MESKSSLILRGMGVLFFCMLYFGSFTSSLYLPHQSLGWRIAMMLLIAFNTWSFVNWYRRRVERRRG